MSLKVRTFFIILYFCLSFTPYFCAALGEDAGVFEVNPTVWRQFTGDVLEIHRELQRKIKECPPTGSHNRAVGRIVVCGLEKDIRDFPFPPFVCYKSNHAYYATILIDKDKGLQESTATEMSQTEKRQRSPVEDVEEECQKERLKHARDRVELDREIIENSFKGARKALPDTSIKTLKTGLPTNTPQQVDVAINDCTKTVLLLQAFQDSMKELRRLRLAEADYHSNYPYYKTHSNRMLDSEVSVCRDVDSYLRRLLQKDRRQISIHIHSDNNPCFCCVQTINHFAQKWVSTFEVTVLVFVSSDKEYIWSGELPKGHYIYNGSAEKPSMREYGRDDRYDQPLTEDELKVYEYSREHSGKVIQMATGGFHNQDV